MTEAFDPYRQWLGVPSGERPPNHYALLGLSLFEQDPEAIDNAADRQMAYVRTHQNGPHAAVTQQLLNELAAARVCLLNAAKKSQYDAGLKAKQAAASRPAAAAPAPPVEPRPAPQPVASLAPQPVAPAAAPTFPRPTTLRNAAPRKPANTLPGWLAPAAGGLAAGVLLATIAMSLGGGDRSPNATAVDGQSPIIAPGGEPASNPTAAAKTSERDGRQTKQPVENKPEPVDAKLRRNRPRPRSSSPSSVRARWA
ncbi:MAG TPA: hypothetical protein VMV10_23440 [Pirellulales bacterium]|nr:hypothetical protein [Pirellulales bacterium]